MCIGGIQDDEFGPLVWDSELEEWVARVRLGGDAAIELRIERPADEESANAISLESRAGFARLHQTESGIRARIAVEYARHYAEWHDDTITQAEMHARLRLNSVRILADGSAEVYYDDGGMFNGNALIAHVGPDGAVNRVEMSG